MTLPLPTKLYKYRDTGMYTESIFNDRELYFAPPVAFNDPFDCGFHILCTGEHNQQVLEASVFRIVRDKHPEWSLQDHFDAAKQVAEAMLESRLDDTTQVFQDKLIGDTNSRVGILALTERSDDILMWSHYADCHKGICLEFQTDLEVGYFVDAKPVAYSDEYPRLDLLKIVKEESFRSSAPWMLTKANHWAYEKEWRILDFENGPGSQSFPARCLSGVILGCRIPDMGRAKVLKWVGQFEHKVEVFQAKESPTHFRLNMEPV